MTRSALATPLLVLAALAAAIPLAGCGDEAAAKAREDALRADLRAEIEKARKENDRTADLLRSAQTETRALRDDVAALGERVAALESRPAAGAAAGQPADPAAVGAAAKPGAKDRKAQLEELKALQDKVFSGDATEDEQRRFWELARETGAIDDLVKSLEAKVKDHPEDVAARMKLADAYISKLMTVPAGMEQGFWSNKAMGQWQAVLKQDPENWDARFSVGFSWSMWPEAFNKTPDAISEFEKLREIQERGAPEAKQAQTYVQLARLYQKQGKTDKAKETLRAGLVRHRDDAELRKALDSLEK